MRHMPRNNDERPEVGFDNAAREATHNAFHIMPSRPLALVRGAQPDMTLALR